ncbi:MAG: Gfo/Idh/MocA family protein [Beutenbergiaceae bacterium]
MTSRIGVAVVGAGTISDEYLTNLTRFPDLEVLWVVDIVPERAKAQAEKYGVPKSGDLPSALADPAVEAVANITIPTAHVEVSKAAMEAGKAVWTEKPLALTRQDGRALLDLAATSGVRLGSATDTFLGAGLQRAQRMIDSGAIGTPVSAVTMMQDPGPEMWHENPDFIYATGAGPLWDRGPYYLAMLTQLFGPMRTVAGMSTQAFSSRTIGSGPRQGESFGVEVPTNVGVLTQFDDGKIAQSTYSYESPLLRMGFVEISGTDATMAVPDPNFFAGDIHIYPRRTWTLPELREVAMAGEVSAPLSTWRKHPGTAFTASRGIGLLEMMRAARAGTPHRASGELGYHVLDALVGIGESLRERRMVELSSDPGPVPPLPQDWDPYAATL